MMSNEEFLKRLEAALTGKVPQEEMDDALRYHREYFAEAGENAANEIPAPEEVAAQIIQDRETYLRKRQLHWAKPAVVAALCVAVVLTIGGIGGRLLLRNWIGWGGYGLHREARYDADVLDQVTFTDEGTAYAIEGSGHGFHHYQEGDWIYANTILDEPFKGIVVEGVSDDVIITRGENFSVDLQHEERESVDCSVEDGTLHITGSVKGVVSTGFQKGQVCVTVPYDVKLDRIQVDTDMGDIYLDIPDAGEVELDTDVGNISVSSGRFNCLDCDSDLGDVSVSSVVAATLKCECDCGNIEATEFDATETELVADLGSITAIALGNQSDYDLELTVDLGELKINGTKQSVPYTQTVHAGRSLHAKADTGYITLDFAQD